MNLIMKGLSSMKISHRLEIIAPMIFGFVFLCTLIFSYFEPHIEEVTGDYVKSHAGMPGYVIVDVRPERVYAGKSPRAGIPGGHIPGAISFPIANLKKPNASAELSEAGVVKGNTIIVYCNTGADSGRFADALIRSLRFSPSDIKNYRGSIMDWISDPLNKLLPENHERADYYNNTGK